MDVVKKSSNEKRLIPWMGSYRSMMDSCYRKTAPNYPAKICVNRQYENCHGYSGNKKAIYREAILAVKSILHSAKPIDAVQVVRCNECVFEGNCFAESHFTFAGIKNPF